MIMANIIIIHGAYGSPGENWFPWLRKELEKKGHKVFVPAFPTPRDQELGEWLKAFEPYMKHLNWETVLVGHSLGPAFILNLLERIGKPVRGAVLVAGFTGKLGLEEFDQLNRTFAERPFDWGKIKQNCRKFVVINSDDDPYVPLEKGKLLADRLGTELIVVKNGGHLNEKAGYKEFHLVLEKIEEIYSSV